MLRACEYETFQKERACPTKKVTTKVVSVTWYCHIVCRQSKWLTTGLDSSGVVKSGRALTCRSLCTSKA